MTFKELNLSAPLLRAVQEAGYETPSPIQAAAIPPVLAGRDLMGCAQTGTGKTLKSSSLAAWCATKTAASPVWPRWT
jgi:superfamily II DNA/RNA helicase